MANALLTPLFLLFRLIHLGQVIGTDELKLMNGEWSPAVSITTRMGALMVLGRVGVGGRLVVPVARRLAGSSLEVPLFYWATRLTLW